MLDSGTRGGGLRAGNGELSVGSSESGWLLEEVASLSCELKHRETAERKITSVELENGYELKLTRQLLKSQL